MPQNQLSATRIWFNLRKKKMMKSFQIF